MDLTKEGFRSWLNSQHPDYPAGSSGLSSQCAFARFLMSQGARHVSVNQYEIAYADRGSFVLTKACSPLWLAKFIHEFDAPARERTCTTAELLPVSFALQCLFRAEEAIEAGNTAIGYFTGYLNSYLPQLAPLKNPAHASTA